MAVYSTGNDTLRDVSVVDVFREIELISYAYLFTCIVIATVLMAYITMVKIRTFNIGFFANVLRHNWLYTIEPIFYQMSISPRRGLNRLIWISHAIGLFVLIHGYVFNLFKVEKLAIMSHPTIDKIDSLLYEPEFTSHRIGLFKPLYFYGYLKSSKDPKLNHLYDRMLSNNNCSTLDHCNFMTFRRDGDYFGEVLSRIDRGLQSGHEVMMFNSHYLRCAVRYFACSMYPELWSKVKSSKQAFASDLLVWFNGRRVPIESQRYLHYIFQTMSEFGLFDMR